MTSAALQKAAAQHRAEVLLPTILEIGAPRPLRDIGAELIQRGVSTERGGRWHPASVERLLRRIGIIPGIEISGGEALADTQIEATIPPFGNGMGVGFLSGS